MLFRVFPPRKFLTARLTRSMLAGSAVLGLFNTACLPPADAQKTALNTQPLNFNRNSAEDNNSASKESKPSGSGALIAMSAEGKPVGQCPLKHTNVSAKISGYVARVTVRQTFENTLKERIEALYTFPLSATAAVDDMVMKVGDRTIHGTIKRKEQARQIYENAKNAGKLASLLDQERSNIFTQSVANIKPGEKVEIILQYVDLLPYESGQYRFDFPTVVGPRFCPFGAGSRDDYDKITPPVVAPRERSGHDIAIDVAIDAGVPIDNLQSKLHDVEIRRSSANFASVALKDKTTIANKDFVLTWNVAQDQLKSGYLTHKEAGDSSGYFTLIILPPKRVTTENTAPKEMIFLIDCSGSQSGPPLDKAKETLKYIIEHMNPQDTFQVVAFSNSQSQLFDRPQPVSASMKATALSWIDALTANGGTWMAPAVEKVCAMPRDNNRLRIVTFMTDGYVGNDFQILGLIRKLRAQSRWFPFGTGNSVNRMLIDGIAREGGGEPDYVLLNTSGSAVGKKFYDRISSPVLTDVKLSFQGLDVKEVFPNDLSDVWAERPLYIKGRYIKPGAGTVTISGFAQGKPYTHSLSVKFPDSDERNAVLGSVWARAKVDRLMSEDYFGAQNGQVNKELKEEIVKTALDHHIMTQYTSFVAVEERAGTKHGVLQTIAVPLEMPDGVSREGVFGKQTHALRRASKPSAQSLSVAQNAQGPAAMAPPPAPQVSMAIAAPEKKANELFHFAPNVFSKDKDEFAAADSEKESDAALQKLDAQLQELCKRGKKSTAARNGKVTINLVLSALTADNLKRLRACGVEVHIQTPGTKSVLGKVAIDKLEDLCLLEFVVSISQVKL